MMRLWRVCSLVLVLLLVGTAKAQTTAVSVTVTDPSGQTWNNGTISYVISGLGPFIWNGAPLPNQYYSPTVVQLDSSGHATFNVPSSNLITPIGNSWKFTVCPNATFSCTTLFASIIGTTLNISSTVDAAIPALSIPSQTIPKAYADSEIQTVTSQGAIYYNTGALTGLRYYNGIVWAAIGSGGGGSGTMQQISPADASLTFSPNPITTVGTLALNVAHPNTWTAAQTFSDGAGNTIEVFNDSTNKMGVYGFGSGYSAGLLLNATQGTSLFSSDGSIAFGSDAAFTSTLLFDYVGSTTNAWEINAGGSNLIFVTDPTISDRIIFAQIGGGAGISTKGVIWYQGGALQFSNNAGTPLPIVGASGAITVGNCAQWGALNTLTDFGSPCSSGSGSGNVSDGSGTTTAGLVPESTGTLHGIDYSTGIDYNHTTAGTVTIAHPTYITDSTCPTCAAYESLGGNTALETVDANTAGFMGPASGTFTAYALQLPAVGPTTAAPILSCPTPSAGGVSACSFVAGGSGGGGDIITSPGGSLSVGGTSTNTTLDLNLAHANIFTAQQSAPSFAGTTGNQTVINLTQGTAASSPPANTIQFGAPLTVTASYNAYLPTLAPTDASGDVWVVPSGGGTGTWQPKSTCGTANIPCLNTANTWTGEQTYNVSATTGATLKLTTSSTSSVVGLDMFSQGGKEWQFVGGGTLFGGPCAYVNDATDSNVIAYAWCYIGGTTVNDQLNSTSVFGWSRSINSVDLLDIGLSRDSAGVLDVGNGTQGNAGATIQFGLFVGTGATQPTGSCSPTGSWAFTKDGHASFCNAGTWVSKI